jgi:hypothetical protein
LSKAKIRKPKTKAANPQKAQKKFLKKQTDKQHK